MAGKTATSTTCCFCFSLDTGVKIIAALMFMVTVAQAVNMIMQPSLAHICLPLAVMYGLTFIFFVFALNKQTIMNRHILWAAYTLIILIGGRSVIFHYLWDGKYFDVRYCSSEQTYEECQSSQSTYAWIAYTLDTLFLFYCGSILWIYSKKPMKKYDDLRATINFEDEIAGDDELDDGYQGIAGNPVN